MVHRLVKNSTGKVFVIADREDSALPCIEKKTFDAVRRLIVAKSITYNNDIDLVAGVVEATTGISYSEAYDLVDCAVQDTKPGYNGVLGIGSTEAAIQDLRQLIGVSPSLRDRKIMLIKVVRTLSGLGLKESKDLVEEALDERRDPFRD